MSKCEHIELSTDDPKKACAFYAKLFKWKFQTFPSPGGGEYLTFRAPDGAGGGGITGKQMPEQPTAWMPYISVKSVKASVKTAKGLGGSAVVEYMPIGDMGAIGVIIDSTGGHIGLWEAGKAAPKAAPAPKKKSARKKSAKKRR